MLYITNADTKWIKPDESDAPADFIPRKSALFSHTYSLSPRAFIYATQSRKIP